MAVPVATLRTGYWDAVLDTTHELNLRNEILDADSDDPSWRLAASG